MNIYLLSQTKHTGYDAVGVSAESEAREINVKLLGPTYEPRGVVLASYNPG